MEKKSSLPIDPSARARIPGTTVAKHISSTSGMEIEIHRLETGGQVFFIDLLRSPKAPPNGYFITGRVTDDAEEPKDRKVFWNFNQEGVPKTDYHGRLCFDEDTRCHFIAILRRLNSKDSALERIILVAELPNLRPVTVGDEVVYLGSAVPIEDQIAAKYRIAADLGIAKANVRFNPFEEVFLKHERKLAREREAKEIAAQKAEEARIAAEKKARAEERQHLRLDIKSRGKLIVYDADGNRLFGYPATQNEWMVMHDKTEIILVREFPAAPLEPVSHFRVSKRPGGGEPKKVNETLGLSLERPAPKAVQPQFQFIGGFLIERDGQPVPVCETDKAGYDQMVQGKMNGGTLVAIKDGSTDAEGKRQIFEFRDDGRPVAIGMYASL